MALKQSYYWAYAIHQGKLVILGAFQTREQAYQTAYTRLPSDFQIIELTTKNQNTVTRIIKFQILQQTNNLDFSLQRARHNG